MARLTPDELTETKRTEVKALKIMTTDHPNRFVIFEEYEIGL